MLALVLAAVKTWLYTELRISRIVFNMILFIRYMLQFLSFFL